MSLIVQTMEGYRQVELQSFALANSSHKSFGPSSIIFINFSYPHLYTRLHSFSTTSSIHVARGRRDTRIRHQHQLCLPRTQDYQAFPLVLFRLQAISSSHTFNRAHTHTHARTHTPARDWLSHRSSPWLMDAGTVYTRLLGLSATKLHAEVL